MDQRTVHPLIQYFLDNRNAQFWSAQICGWVGISFVSYFSLNLWYNQPEFGYIAHNILQSLLGMLVSWPMRPIFRKLWNDALPRRIALTLLTVLVFALIWSVMRLLLFMLLTEESGLWSDFGGWLFPSIFIFLCWTALYHGVKYYQLLQEEHQMLLKMASARQEQSLKLFQAEALARQAQLTMLRYQLNPHFLFNTLNAISSLVSAGNAATANQMLLCLSDFLRYSLDSDPVKEVSLSQEIEALELYLKIEQTRFGDRLRVSIDVSDDAQPFLIPSLILQPLVENAIK